MGELAEYIGSIRRFAGRRLWHAAALVVAAVMVEGFGILAILPFAAVFTGDADSGPARAAISALDQIGLEAPAERAIALTGAFVAILAVRNLIIWRREIYLAQLGMDFVDHWRSRLFRAIGAAPWASVSSLRRTDLEHAITNDVARLNSGTDQLLGSTVSAALIVVQLAILASLAPMLMLVVLFLIALAALIVLPLVRNAELLGGNLTRAGRRIHGVLGDFLASQKLARLHDSQARFTGHFETAITETRAQQMAHRRSQSAARAWFQLIGGTVIAATLLLGLLVFETQLAVLLLALVVMARIVPPIISIMQTSQYVANMLPAFNSVRVTEAALIAEARQMPVPNEGLRNGPGPASLYLRSICFRHPGQKSSLIDGFSLEVACGEIVALEAPSGTGKTTLLDIAAGLYAPEKGEIAIDGCSVADERDWQAWRSGLSYLPQDPFLFDASLRENLLWCAPGASEEAMWAALEGAEIADLVAAMPQGLDARAGERGTSLSGGERQRICIARGLLRQPRFMILDEATNALDRDLEALILQRLCDMRDRFSLLLVTHRREALRFADRVVRL